MWVYSYSSKSTLQVYFCRTFQAFWGLPPCNLSLIHIFTELLNGADVKSSAPACPQFFTQRLAAWHNADFAEIQKLFALCKQLRSLLLKFIAVNDHYDRRRTDFRHIGAAECKLTGKECHSICLATASGAKIGSTFSTFFTFFPFFKNRFYNALLQKARSKKLWIPADNFVSVSYTHLDVYKRQLLDRSDWEAPASQLSVENISILPYNIP